MLMGSFPLMIYLHICMKLLCVNPSFPRGQMAGIKNNLEGRLRMQAIASGLPPSSLCVSDEGKKCFFRYL